jgi:hypothetical protein
VPNLREIANLPEVNHHDIGEVPTRKPQLGQNTARDGIWKLHAGQAFVSLAGVPASSAGAACVAAGG